MKRIYKFFMLVLLMMPLLLSAQKHTPLPHGMTYGQKVDSLQNIPATNLENFMGKKTRISTTIHGKVLKVTKVKGGWFDMDGGNGKIIHAHFKNMGVTLPTDLTGRKVMVQGVAQRLFTADDMQHFAGDTVVGAKQHNQKVDPKQRITFEVAGLMVL